MHVDGYQPLALRSIEPHEVVSLPILTTVDMCFPKRGRRSNSILELTPADRPSFCAPS
jgi:hypothetical protein